MSYSGKAQQDMYFSQYMFNGLVLNPAYSGSRDVLSITADYRSQWSDIEGAPVSQTLTAHSPLKNQHVALGATLFHDQVGPFNEFGFYATYAYRIAFGRYKLNMGLQAGVTSMEARWTTETTIVPGDIAFITNSETLVMPNFGAGLFFFDKKFYAGLSIPFLLTNDIDLDQSLIQTSKSDFIYRDFFLTTGYVIKLSPVMKLKPSLLFSYNLNNDLVVDVNVNVLFNETFWFGGGYRNTNTVVMMAEYQLKKQLNIGYTYDLFGIGLDTKAGNTHELMLRYEFNLEKDNIKNPRYF